MGWGNIYPEVLHPGEDVAHSAGMSVAGASMANGLATDRVLPIIEYERHEGGLEDVQQGCVGCAKTTSSNKKMNILELEGVQMRIIAPFTVPIRTSQEEKTMGSRS